MPHHKRRIRFLLALLAAGFLAGVALTASPAQAASGAGPFFPEPAWDRKLQALFRFYVLTDWNNAAVLDKETGLVWERSPAQTGSWSAARSQCANLTTGNRRGWRLPSLHELRSLMEPTMDPAMLSLPLLHPFSNLQLIGYWSATIEAQYPNLAAWWVSFLGGGGAEPAYIDMAGAMGIWCVRGGLHTDTY